MDVHMLSQSAPDVDSRTTAWSKHSSNLSAQLKQVADHPLASTPNLNNCVPEESSANSRLSVHNNDAHLHPVHSDPQLSHSLDSSTHSSFTHKRSSVSPHMETLISNGICLDKRQLCSTSSQGFIPTNGTKSPVQSGNGVSFTIESPLEQSGGDNNSNSSNSLNSCKGEIKSEISDKDLDRNIVLMNSNKRSLSGDTSKEVLNPATQKARGRLSNSESDCNGLVTNGTEVGSPSGVFFSNSSSKSGTSAASGDSSEGLSLRFTYNKAGDKLEVTEYNSGNSSNAERGDNQKSSSRQSSVSDLSSTEELKAGSGESGLSASEAGASFKSRSARGSTLSKKKVTSWYSVLSSTYKSRHEEFKRIFKDVPKSERLIVDYACALQRNILVQGRMYISQNWVCFYANILGIETSLMLQFKDILQITKEKTALVFSNAIQISTKEEKYFIASLNFRDKTYLILAQLWQNATQNQMMLAGEKWNMIHYCYGDDLGLESDDDDDYIEPLEEDKVQFKEKIEAAESLVQWCPDSISEVNEKDELAEKVVGAGSAQGKEVKSEQTEHISESLAVNHCNEHEHFEINALNEVFNYSIDSLFKHCLTDSHVYRTFAAEKPLLDVASEPWSDAVDSEGQRVRNISYTLSLNNPMGPKTAATTEKQIMYAASKPGEFYLIDTECNSPSLPYGESFYISNRYCFTRITSNTTRLHITSRINYRKSVWGFVKGILDKNVTVGVGESFGLLASILRRESHASDIGVQSVGAEEAQNISGSASSLRLRRTESKSTIKSPARSLMKHRELFVNGGIISANVLRVLSKMVALLLILLVVCNIFLMSRLWTTTSTTPTSTQSIEHISIPSDIVGESPVSSETQPSATTTTDRYLAIQLQLSLQQRELDHMKAILQTLETSVSELKETMHSIAKSVKQR